MEISSLARKSRGDIKCLGWNIPLIGNSSQLKKKTWSGSAPGKRTRTKSLPAFAGGDFFSGKSPVGNSLYVKTK
jgi:hypothetical protein